MLGLGRHARERMRERRISEQEIEQALTHRDVVYEDEDLPSERTIICGLTQAGRRLKIVVEAADEQYVITVMDQDSEG